MTPSQRTAAMLNVSPRATFPGRSAADKTVYVDRLRRPGGCPVKDIPTAIASSVVAVAGVDRRDGFRLVKKKKPPRVDRGLPFGKLRRRSGVTPASGKDPKSHQSRAEQGQGGWFRNWFLLSRGAATAGFEDGAAIRRGDPVRRSRAALVQEGNDVGSQR